MTNIEWTDATWNPVTGCTRVSAGVACFVKHLGARPVDREGGDPEEWPRAVKL